MAEREEVQAIPRVSRRVSRPARNYALRSQPLEQRPKRRDLNFGLLKVKEFSKKQSQAVIYGEKEELGSSNFSRMSNERLMEIVTRGSLDNKRALSRYFSEVNGMYSRAVRYLSDMYRFDYLVYPNLEIGFESGEKIDEDILKAYEEVLEHFENTGIYLMGRAWASRICLDGSYYGYICDDVKDKFVVQDLPAEYCRSRFTHRGVPLIEFNIEYFDDEFNKEKDRNRILDLFPPEFREHYDHKEREGQSGGFGEGTWYLLDSDKAFKFSFDESDRPPFLSAIPSLIELGEIQDLEKEKLLQQIQKILVQTFELNDRGELPFQMNELQQLNQNALDMVGDAVGVSCLSTIAKVSLEDLAPNDGKKSESAVQAGQKSAYNDFGISSNLFNTDGNLALEKSTTIDEAFVKPLLLQIEQLFNRYIDKKFNTKDIKFRLKMLTTTNFNHKQLSDSYKDLTKVGFSRFLPMVALGHSIKEILSLAKLEQTMLDLNTIMLPPFSSNTMSSQTWSEVKAMKKGGKIDPKEDEGKGSAKEIEFEDGKSTGGRPKKPDSEKSDKTIANQEAQS